MYELEALALVSCLEHWSSLTQHHETICNTDNTSCRAVLLQARQPTLRRAKLATRLGQFDSVTIKYVKADQNKAADCLSRMHDNNDDSSTSDDNIELQHDNGQVDTKQIRRTGIKVSRPGTRIADIIKTTAEAHNNLLVIGQEAITEDHDDRITASVTDVPSILGNDADEDG